MNEDDFDSEIQRDITAMETELRDLQRALDAARTYRALRRKQNGVKAPTMTPEPLLPLTPNNTAKNGSKKKPTAAKAIREAIASCATDYTVYDLGCILTARGTPVGRPALSQFLSRLLKDKEITLKTPGKGPKPNIFTKEVPPS